MSKKITAYLLCLLFFLLFTAKAAAQHNDSEKVINYIINTDESTVVDQILYHALQRIGYGMTMDAMPMIYAIQMANSGERDALAVHARGTELTYTNLVMVPESIVEVGFQVYVRKGSDITVRTWNDLSGLVVGHLFQKRRIMDEMPKDIAGSIQRETFYELNLALLAGECDVIVTTSTFNKKLITADGIVYLTTIDITLPVTFVNKKFEFIANDFAKSLAQMKADGTYEKIVNGQWRSNSRQMSVLHISSFYAEDLWDSKIRDGIITGLNANGITINGSESSEEVLYYNVSLYANRFRSEYEQAKNAYYSIRTIMMKNPPDVIIASDIDAILFVCNHYYPLFSDIPVILYGIDCNFEQLWQLGGNYTALWQTMPAAENAEMIKKLFPQTTDIYVINDYTKSGIAWRADIESSLGKHFNGMNVSYNRNLSYADLIDEISALRENTAVLIGYFTTDADGIYYSQSQIDSIILGNTSCPVFEMRYGCIGSGQVGGKYIDPYYQGIVLGKSALNILYGSVSPETLSNPSALKKSRWIFDEEVIFSRGISKKLLPQDAELINHKPGLYEVNPEAAIAITVAGALSFILIFGLIVFSIIMKEKNRRLYEREKTILKQKTSNTNLENILNGLEAMVLVTDPTTDKIIFINNIMKKTFNVPENCIGGKCYAALRRLEKRCKFCPCMKLDETPDKMVVWEDHHKLTERTFRSFSRYITWPDGNRVHLQYSVDITESIQSQNEIIEKSKQLETALLEAEKANNAKSSFLANVSHEIRTPMNVILGSAESLLENQSYPKEIKEILEKICYSGDLLLNIINDILDLSKIESDKFEIIPAKYEAANLITSSVNLNIAKYEQKNIKFKLNVDENIPLFLFGDELRIKQIIINLLSNAYKYTDTGEITMDFFAEKITLDKIKLVIRVKDTGQGMTEEQIEKLFTEYTRFNIEANRTTVGTGLGLLITRNLARLMGGDIQVESVPEKGTVFTVFIAQEIADNRVLGKEAAGNFENFRFNNNNAKKKEKIEKIPMPYGKVLIVDDMKSNIDVAKLLLKSYQLQIETALSGFEAIELIKSGKEYDIIFMDHMMPKMDGIETVNELRSMGYTGKIMALTANAIVGQTVIFLENGFDGCITKPIDTRELDAMLNEHIRKNKIPDTEQ